MKGFEIIADNSHDKVFNYQKRLLKIKVWYAALRHCSQIMISKEKNVLLPDTLEWLKSKGFKVRYFPYMHVPHIGNRPGFWSIEW